VTGVYFEPGANVRAGETVVRVVGGGRGLRVRVALPEEDQASAAGAKRASLVLEDGRVLGARVDRVSPEVDPASRTLLVEGTAEVGPDCADCVSLAGHTVRATLTR
jgi:multidrug efflux pump subunit AcrA (membrane-fusion protein)